MKPKKGAASEHMKPVAIRGASRAMTREEGGGSEQRAIEVNSRLRVASEDGSEAERSRHTEQSTALCHFRIFLNSVRVHHSTASTSISRHRPSPPSLP